MTNGDELTSEDDDRPFTEVAVHPDDDPPAGFPLVAGEPGVAEGEEVGPAPAGRRPRRRIGRYALGVAVVLVLVAGILFGPTLWHVYAARHTTLVLPDQVAGLTRDTGGDSAATADYLRDAVGTSTSLSKPVGAVYLVGGDKTHSVLLFGGTGAIFRPSHTLDQVLGLLDDSADGISDLHEVPAGPLGGVLKCGVSVGSDDGLGGDPDIPVCGWADHGSVVAALFPGRTVEAAADLMREFRTAVEHR